MPLDDSRSVLGGACAALLLLSGCDSAGQEPTLAAVAAAAAKYRDVKVAIEEGYTTDNKCVTAEMLGFPAEQGAMGLHYVRKDLLGIGPPAPGRVRGTGTYTDFAKPAMLVYEPQPDGSMTLVAVENLVFQSAWRAAGNRQPPSFHGTPYLLLKDDPATRLDEAHGFEPHYELHAWVFRDNPNGMFAPFSPKVTCRHHRPAQAQPQAHGGHGATAAAVPAIGVAEARAMVAANALLIDVREPHELAASGKLEGAVNMPLSSFEARAKALPRSRPIVLYCRTGRRSELAGEMLRELGFASVHNLGGFDAATAAGWPSRRG